MELALEGVYKFSSTATTCCLSCISLTSSSALQMFNIKWNRKDNPTA